MLRSHLHEALGRQRLERLEHAPNEEVVVEGGARELILENSVHFLERSLDAEQPIVKHVNGRDGGSEQSAWTHRLERREMSRGSEKGGGRASGEGREGAMGRALRPQALV